MTTPDSPRDRLERALAGIRDPALEGERSCLTTYTESARAEADAATQRQRAGNRRGPLDGSVITIKDLFDVRGEITRAGSPAWARHAQPAAADAPIIAALRAAGAVIVAKTNMTEFAFSGLGINPHFGTPGNPRDRRRIPGGSSSGAAVALADGIGELAIGTDTGGSTRIPAALCGLVGWKPTARRISTQGVHPLSTTLDSVGPIAADVARCHAADAVMAGGTWGALEPASLTGLRFGAIQGMPLEQVDDTVATTYTRTLSRIAAVSGVRDVALEVLQLMADVNERGGIAPAEAFTTHRSLLFSHGSEVDPFVRQRMQAAAHMPAPDYIANLRDRAVAIAQLDEVFDTYDALLLPTTPIVAPLLHELKTPEAMGSRNRLLLRNTAIANFFDLCAISLPMHQGEGLPCGLMLFGRSNDDAKLFRIAAALEAELAR
ncbi:MAG: amidase [Polyangiales bacterium]